ncbi:MAG TPA: hypothetical protein V6C91_01205 [Coleofasciculaceae cyanobacterium]
MLALVIVLIGGWLLASGIGTWAYFAGKSEENVTPFENIQPETYTFLRQQRQAKLKLQPSARIYDSVKAVY